VRKDAAHWIDIKKHLPDEAQEMERDHQAIAAVDLNAIAATIEKAEGDWPEKKTDLDTRLASLRATAANAEQAWQNSANARRAAAENDASHTDFGALFGAADTLKTAATDLPQQAGALKALTSQLYVSWDKVLVDMEVKGSQHRQKVKTVRTQVADASSKQGVTTSDENWVDVSKPQYQAMERNLGMAIEHKPAGRYDIESERVAQPAGFAYMAPPGQSNRYGYWEHSGGRDFWVFYGQYALMRDLLFSRDYRPLDRYEYDSYRTYQQRGQTYYGTDTGGGGQKYGTSGATTQQRYSGSTFAKSGGFKDSKYASKPGGYRDSQYATPAARDPNVDRSPRSFGSGGSKPQASPPPSRSYRPAPSRPSMPRSSPPRSFGRRR